MAEWKNLPDPPGSGGACQKHGVYDGYGCPKCAAAKVAPTVAGAERGESGLAEEVERFRESVDNLMKGGYSWEFAVTFDRPGVRPVDALVFELAKALADAREAAQEIEVILQPLLPKRTPISQWGYRTVVVNAAIALARRITEATDGR